MAKTNQIFRQLSLLLSISVLLGYFVVLTVMPTNTFWQSWYPHLAKKLTSTYFGNQGMPLLILCFPLLFVAVLGCIYLHFDAKSIRGQRSQVLRKLKKPMLVRGPLGIVSGIELAFLIMFIALLIWTLSTYMRNSFSTITPQFAAQKGEKVWEAKLESAAFLLSLTGNLCLVFLFFPVSRGSSLLPLFGLTSESSIKYHIWLGHLAMLFFTAHGLGFIVYWANTGQISQVLKWGKAEVSNVAGEIALISGLGLWSTTFPNIRIKMFELFFYTHHLYIFFIIFFFFHISFSISSILMLPGFYLFVIDRYIRFLQSRTKVRLVSARVLPCQTLELNFSKSPGLRYSPTSILFMNVPSISKLQWHPFTISSSSSMDPDILSVVIESEGSWSSKLYNVVSSPLLEHLQVSVEGPYGPASTQFLRHETLVMVSGGSGITPFISIVRELIHVSKTLRQKTPQVVLICSFKTSSDLTMLELLLPSTVSVTSLPNDFHLKIKAFVTREKQPTNNHSNPNQLVRTTWFKPDKTDKPISPILGPKSWLWLGAIISSSFVMCLLVIGLITRYYIYPIDHGTDQIFSYPAKTSIYAAVMCLSIMITASVSVVWNKKQNEKEARRFESSSEGEISYGDKELESLPLLDSVVELADVHYGQRPNLKCMLLEHSKESSVGVLVCGPKKMRHEVASICSSGSADNLHFESISFTW